MNFPDPASYEDALREAVDDYWRARAGQAQQQELSGKVDAGTRGQVTGGKHLDSLTAVVAQVVSDCGMHFATADTQLPGYYRGSKNWDGVVVHNGKLAMIFEFKSQVGSFGNNLNNRVEEMLGQSRDIALAAESDLIGQLSPWFAYLMLVEGNPKSERPVSTRTRSDYPADPVFAAKPSYVDRYKLALSRMRLKGDLSAACLIVSSPGSHRYPDQSMSFRAFAAAIQARAHEVANLDPGS